MTTTHRRRHPLSIRRRFIALISYLASSLIAGATLQIFFAISHARDAGIAREQRQIELLEQILESQQN